MVLIKDLKDQILYDQIPPFIVFTYKKSSFLSEHYVKQIALQNEKPILYVDRPEDLSTQNIFVDLHKTNTLVLICEEIDCAPTDLAGYVICKKASPSLEHFTCETPEPEEWQLKDYLYSNCEGANPDDLDQLFSLISNDPIQLDTEMEKLRFFSAEERKHLLPTFLMKNTKNIGKMNKSRIS